MPVPFERMREMESRRVKMCFDDGQEVIARLLSATEDIEGKHHLIYNQIEWTKDPEEMSRSVGSTVYAEGESLVSIDEVTATHA